MQFQSKDDGSNECFTFGTKNVSGVEFYMEKRIICRRVVNVFTLII